VRSVPPARKVASSRSRRPPSSRHWTIAVWVAFAALSAARIAHAEDGSPAQTAYERGVEEFRAGNLERACGLLADSYRLEPLPGVLFTWATCELRADRVASAAQHYADFLDATGKLPPAERSAQDERRQVAQRERARILPDLPYLTIVVAAEALRTSTVRRDGEVLPVSALGVELAVDPGEHVIDFEGADGLHAQQRIVLAKRDHKTIVVGFAKPKEVTPPSPKPVSEPTPEPVLPKLYERQVTPWIYLTGGVGVAGLLTGSVAGVLAIRDKGVVNDACKGPACTARGNDAAKAARLEATVSTVGFGVGLAGAIATAIVYIVDSGRSSDASLPGARASARRWSLVGISPGVLGVGGAF
jgi:hypothetical protein